MATSCICSEGFSGTRCDIDLPFCDVDACLNGGTCNEGFGRMTTCDCAAGFTGSNCSSDLNFCMPSTCLNGGTCVEGYGTETLCMCTKEFSGPNCTTCVAGKFFQMSMTGCSNQSMIIATVPFFIIIFVYTDMKLETSAMMFLSSGVANR